MKTEGKGLFSPALQPLKDEGRGNPWKERCNTREWLLWPMPYPYPPQGRYSSTYAVPVNCKQATNTVHQTAMVQVFYYIEYARHHPIPSPNHPHYHSWFCCKSEYRSEWPGGRWERCRAPHGPFGAEILHGGCASAMLLFRSKTLWAGNAFCHKYIQGLKQLGLSFGSSFWAPILMTVILITKISLKIPGTKGFFATFWIFFILFFFTLGHW